MKPTLAYLLTLPLLFSCSEEDKGSLEEPEETSSSSTTSSTPVEKKPVDPATAGTIVGTVSFEGPAPEPRTVPLGGVMDCSKMHTTKPKSEEYVIHDGKMANVLVYLNKKPLKSFLFPEPKDPHIVDQKGCIYIPHVSAMQTGQEVRIKNSDPLLHNVRFNPKKNKSDNRAMNKGTPDLVYHWDKDEVITLRCDVHPWMKSHVGVFSHPFFAVTGKDGSFQLEGVPPGKYTVYAWHEELGRKQIKIELPAKGKAEANFSFKQ